MNTPPSYAKTLLLLCLQCSHQVVVKHKQMNGVTRGGPPVLGTMLLFLHTHFKRRLVCVFLFFVDFISFFFCLTEYIYCIFYDWG